MQTPLTTEYDFVPANEALLMQSRLDSATKLPRIFRFMKKRAQK
jgi:hypothetical protein